MAGSFKESRPLRVVVTLAVLFLLSATVLGQMSDERSPWSRSREERDARINKAESEQYYVRRIYISGSTYTRPRDFRKRMLPEFNEGFIFSPRPLHESVRRIAKMRPIYPITIDDVEVMLDEESKSIDFRINVRQKPRS